MLEDKPPVWSQKHKTSSGIYILDRNLNGLEGVSDLLKYERRMTKGEVNNVCPQCRHVSLGRHHCGIYGLLSPKGTYHPYHADFNRRQKNANPF